jgi:sulfite dehydrogenase (quinone) subunit SoeC
MRPAFSVIFLTTLIGAAQGLFIALYAAELGGFAFRGSPFLFVGGLVVSGLALLGLAASFFHLGRPSRAWRSAAMWRTSWLSREVIALPAFIALAALYGLAHLRGWPGVAWIGAAALVSAIALFVCTAMIYMCLRFLQEWASPLTLVNFILLGCASGFTLATLLANWLAPSLVDGYAAMAIILTVAAFTTRAWSLARNARLRPKSTLQTATGIKGRVVQQSQGFTAGSFNTREFFHGVTPAKLRAIKWAFITLVFPVPVLLLALGGPWTLATAFAIQYVGLIAERWYFFAQANHPQNLYYQAIA